MPLPPKKMVEVEKITRQDFQQTIDLLGTVNPKHTAVMTANGTGILDIFIPSGEKTKKGTLLAKIINPELENHVMLSQKAEQLAKSQYERLTLLVKKGFVSPREVEEKKQIWIQAQKELSRAKIEAENLKFYAPFDGIVGAYKKREGALVSSGEPVVTIYDPSSLVVDVDIPCSNLDSIHEGSIAYVLGKRYRLTHLQKMLDESTHMCPGDIEIDCNACLVGNTVRVQLVSAERKNALVIPFQALVLKDSKPHVYLVEEGKIVLKPVKTGLRQKEQIEILQGLQPGQKVVSKGQEQLHPGMEVSIYQPETYSQTTQS
ncbi:efflux protein [Legionella londiniensis]|uniref:Efflux protein n=2 Tax=Legionella londiniensis TaxID=45068 RepID=A0A0W0VLW9_9GAMM|nr:efflux protein [Legionella londiniensis]STX93160.1 efflux protein [Legionella londiniensis]